jgi:peptidoglycan/xylan/chitin deacetylase (PgdA/CDA1 family)
MIRGKRNLLARMMDVSGLTGLVQAARRQLPPTRLVVVNYHRVACPWETRDFDEGVRDATPASFAAQVTLLRRAFTIIKLADLLEHLRGGPLPPNPALITFDDGYKDNYEQALPILQRLRTSAVFFIATDFISRRRLFWWDRIGYTLKHATRARFGINYPERVDIDLSDGITDSAQRLIRVAASSPNLDFDRFLSEISDGAGIPWTAELERDLANRALMTWEQIKGLHDAGMEIGSHTRRHRVLTTIGNDDLANELGGSKIDLEEKLGIPVRAVSYPIGGPIAGYPDIRAAVEAAGYQVGFSYLTGIQRLPCHDPFDICRIPVDSTWNDSRFRGALSFDWLG